MPSPPIFLFNYRESYPLTHLQVIDTRYKESVAMSAYEVIVNTITGIPKNTKEYILPYERFERSPPTCFFKKLFIGDSSLARNFKKMSERNGVLKGLKDKDASMGIALSDPLSTMYLSLTRYRICSMQI